ncbi:MAG: pyridoxamine 5'-phosphate oxidase [Gammaproteobacteria bacterium]|nr:pyridoxamine 5'-phosphate oxidase [Gammaproteobacteria bacterium]MYF61929.1 pyridoxamine 5'-phosphate oxidase [Gammaproteobacteria bacterium]MYI23434.1 pyridoxamine 5'-phosphate oxidase [Gammaproteobacteria bacterium]
MSLKSNLRLVFSLGRGLTRGLPDADPGLDPIQLFGQWFAAARKAGILLPEAMTLATASADGAPSARMVLLKGFGEDGFEFYTNLGSRKADELTANPRAALCFHWGVLQRQVRVEGDVTQLSRKASAAYFRTRPRGSQVGAWASHQSQTLEQRETLVRRVREIETRFEGGEVPLPDFWGGYMLEPQRIEFWQGRADRLHDRLLFQREGDGWSSRRLHP